MVNQKLLITSNILNDPTTTKATSNALKRICKNQPLEVLKFSKQSTQQKASQATNNKLLIMIQKLPPTEQGKALTQMIKQIGKRKTAQDKEEAKQQKRNNELRLVLTQANIEKKKKSSDFWRKEYNKYSDIIITLLTWAIKIAALYYSLESLKHIPATVINNVRNDIQEKMGDIHLKEAGWFQQKTGYVNPFDTSQLFMLKITDVFFNIVGSLSNASVDIVRAISLISVVFGLLLRGFFKNMNISIAGGLFRVKHRRPSSVTVRNVTKTKKKSPLRLTGSSSSNRSLVS